VQRRKRILIVDDHPFVREGLKQILAAQATAFEVAAEAANVAEACAAVAREEPDVAVVDLALGPDDGVELVRWLRKRHPAVRILVLSMQDEALYAERMLRLGVGGYVMKNAASEDFVTALERVARGQRHLSDAMNARVRGRPVDADPDAADLVATLTTRERQVFRAIGAGASSREMADTLGISIKTIEAHRRRILEKLNLASRVELVRYATDWLATTDAP